MKREERGSKGMGKGHSEKKHVISTRTQNISLIEVVSHVEFLCVEGGKDSRWVFERQSNTQWWW